VETVVRIAEDETASYMKYLPETGNSRQFYYIATIRTSLAEIRNGTARQVATVLMTFTHENKHLSFSTLFFSFFSMNLKLTALSHLSHLSINIFQGKTYWLLFKRL
jgi:hypothetical protein